MASSSTSSFTIPLLVKGGYDRWFSDLGLWWSTVTWWRLRITGTASSNPSPSPPRCIKEGFVPVLVLVLLEKQDGDLGMKLDG
ncbi:hypothetical protein Droror1_Dr00025072 [Drosera rotundifolia]